MDILERKMYDCLSEWKARKHKCLPVKGQRQVGKTHAIGESARDNCEHAVKIDIATDEVPRGYEGAVMMTSMDFEEFLWAVGFPGRAIGEMKESIRTGEPLGRALC